MWHAGVSDSAKAAIVTLERDCARALEAWEFVDASTLLKCCHRLTGPIVERKFAAVPSLQWPWLIAQDYCWDLILQVHGVRLSDLRWAEAADEPDDDGHSLEYLDAPRVYVTALWGTLYSPFPDRDG
jgi:hypothetical protein